MAAVETVVEVKGLKVHFDTEDGVARAVDGVDFSIAQERTLGVVGESGCGKSVTARAMMGLVEPPGYIVQGEILLHRKSQVVDICKLPTRGPEIRNIRGAEIAMIFQEPMTSLNPVFRIGDQIVEGILLHSGMSRTDARDRAVELLAAVGIPMPRQRVDSFPHQLSGGMRQRAMIAMAMACSPRLLIADEPTTALDVTIQAQIMDLINDLRRDFKASIMFITHDLGVIAGMADDVVVMYAGTIVESGPVREIFRNAMHPYTLGLMNSIPSLAGKTARRLNVIEGVVPSPLAKEPGCQFAPRCPHAMSACRTAAPALTEISPGHHAACLLHQAAP